MYKTMQQCITKSLNPVMMNLSTKKNERHKPRTLQNSISQIPSNSFSFNDLEFKKWAPEIINGRCAMIGVVSGLGNEYITGLGVLEQPHVLEAFLATVVLITVASLKSGDPDLYLPINKPFVPEVEKLNGRIAMLGTAAYLLRNLI